MVLKEKEWWGVSRKVGRVGLFEDESWWENKIVRRLKVGSIEKIRGKGGRFGAGRGVCGFIGRCVIFFVVCVLVCED